MRYVLLAATLGASLPLLPPAANAASTERISVSSAEVQADRSSSSPSISEDGRFVAFVSDATNLVRNDTNGLGDIFLRDRRYGGSTHRISVGSGGAQANGASDAPSISADGRFVAFGSVATNLVPDDTNGVSDVFVHDRRTGATERVSLSVDDEQFEHRSYSPSISGDGRYVAFVLNYPRGQFEAPGSSVLVRDRLTGTTSRSFGGVFTKDPSISANGRWLAISALQDLDFPDFQVGKVNLSDAFATATSGGVVARIGEHGDDVEPSISADGRSVAYTSNNEFSDNNDLPDIYLLSSRTRVSVGLGPDPETNNPSGSPSISGNARFVAFESSATNLISGDTNAAHDVFVRNLAEGTTERISVDSLGKQAKGGSRSPSASGDGQFVAFVSGASNLVAGDTNARQDVFVRDRGVLRSNQSDLAIDFGPRGLWVLLNNRVWSKIDNASPAVIALGDLDRNLRDELIAGFPGRGLLARYNNAGDWQKLHDAVPKRLAAGDFSGFGAGNLAAHFPSPGGLWVRADFQNSWTRWYDGGNNEGLQTADLDASGKDDLILKVSPNGLLARFNNAPGWTHLSGAPIRFTTGDLNGDRVDDLVSEIGGGLEVRYAITPTGFAAPPVRILNRATQGLATGDLDDNGEDEVLAVLEGQGLFAFFNDTAHWVHLTGRSPTSFLAADIDGRGGEDVIASFGNAGVFVRYNKTGPFRLLRAWPAQTIHAGRFD